ncbi:MAG: hypothetical protein ACR2JB_12140 [Bryobacteraceae bacterium]
MPPHKSPARSASRNGNQGHDLRDDDADVMPIPGDWPRIYTAVLCYLFILIAGLYVVSRLFTY